MLSSNRPGTWEWWSYELAMGTPYQPPDWIPLNVMDTISSINQSDEWRVFTDQPTYVIVISDMQQRILFMRKKQE